MRVAMVMLPTRCPLMVWLHLMAAYGCLPAGGTGGVRLQ